MTHRTTNISVPEVQGNHSASDMQKRRELRKHKAIATGLLLLATTVYVLMRVLEYQAGTGNWTGVGVRNNGELAPWVGYVRAGAEAGMIGALADWFAVTALFRHPLHIPIPHTAIIKRKKDQVGEQ